MVSKPSVWIRDILKPSGPYHAALQRLVDWIPDEPVSLFPLGGGHYGYAYAVVGPNFGKEDPPARDRVAAHSRRIVLKITRDPTEGPFCRWIQERQEDCDGLFTSAFARMHDVRRLPTDIRWRGKEWPVFAIVREEIQPVFGYEPLPVTSREAGKGTVFRALQMAGRALSRPRKRGRAQLEMLVDSSGQPAFSWTSGGERRKLFDAEHIWDLAVQRLYDYAGYEAVAEAFVMIRERYGIYMQDVHMGNLGRRIYPQESDGCGYWGNQGGVVIFDPGHTPTNQGLAIERLENPTRGVRVPVLE